jgi:hypothetical protein
VTLGPNDNADGWVEAAKRAHDVNAAAWQEHAQAREELEAEIRLADAAARIELEDARLLRAAEERAVFEDVHIQGREKRRQQALERKAMLVKIEANAHAEMVAIVQGKEARLAAQQDEAGKARQDRKARVLLMLEKVKGVETLGVLGC